MKVYCHNLPEIWEGYFRVGSWYEVLNTYNNLDCFRVVSQLCELPFLVDKNCFLTLEEYKKQLVKKRYEI